MGNSLGQYCLNVSDLERSVTFYTEVLGLELHSRTQIPGTNEAVVWGRGQGSALQLAEHDEKTAPIDQSPEGIKKVGALWKLYLSTDDVQGLHAKAVAAGVDADSESQVLVGIDQMPGAGPAHVASAAVRYLRWCGFSSHEHDRTMEGRNPPWETAWDSTAST